MSAGQRSDAEETGGIHDTKVSDSGYSNSCSNSQSQRSSGSSESRHSSSSGSSGYCGHQSTLAGLSESGTQQQGSKRKDKEHTKKKAGKAAGAAAAAAVATSAASGTQPEVGPPPSPPPPDPPTQQTPTNTCDGSAKSGAKTPTSDSEALQIAALAQTLTCIKKFKCKEKTPSDDLEVIVPEQSGSVDSQNHDQIINCLKVEPTQDELSIVVSLRDGIVLYTTPNITELLGFPKDMWVGRSLIDFVHSKHRVAFASHITSIIANPLNSADPSSTMNGSGGAGNSCTTGAAGGGTSTVRETGNTSWNAFFCCLRQYRGLRSSGFSVTDKKVAYLPCQLTTTFRELPATGNSRNCVFLVITAVAVRSAYKYGDEVKSPSKFMTRHLASCLISHVDSDVMPYFGYLPQDMIGRSVFDYYHPEDLRHLRDAYQSVMKDQGQPTRTKPYRFRCQNGEFALVETEWSSFINPWSRKLEFVIGQHTVLRGPPNPDVTTPVNEPEPFQVSEEVLKESKALQEEIKCLLAETVVQTSETAKQQVSKRCKDLATFMEALMDTKPHDLKVDVLTEDHSFSERDSVMLGEISPHHEYYNSKSSTETPPSYNQLNYNENLQRFFESQPKTILSDESESKNEQPLMMAQSSSSADEHDRRSPLVNSSDASLQRPCCFANNMDGSGTSSGQSTETNSNGNCGEQTKETTNTTDNTGYKPPTLTEQLLSKHNEDMEKQMMQKHRELRNKGGGKNKDRHKTAYDKMQDEGGGGAHGIKRSGSHSWEGEHYKSMKQVHNTTESAAATKGAPTTTGHHHHHHHQHHHHHHNNNNNNNNNSNEPPPAQEDQQQHQRISRRRFQQQQQQEQGPKVKLWPPYSVGMTPLHSTPPNFSTPTLASPIVPMFYVPEPPRPTDTRRMRAAYQHPAYITHQVPYMPGMMYQGVAVFGSPGVVYSPLTMLPQATSVYPQPAPPSRHQPPINNHHPPNPTVQALSDKGKSVSSAGVLSPALIMDKRPNENDADSNGTSHAYDDSSNYSSFYSFLKTTDKSDDSMKSSPQNDAKIEEMIWEKSDQKGQTGRPIKKVAPWLEDINVTPDLLLKYRLRERHLKDVLEQDYKALERITQPSMVNEQLSQMYLDLEVEGLSRELTLEEGITSSSDSSGEDTVLATHKNKKKRYMEYDKMVILFEENAPLPPPPSIPS